MSVQSCRQLGISATHLRQQFLTGAAHFLAGFFVGAAQFLAATA
jgi:hypothetical protein